MSELTLGSLFSGSGGFELGGLLSRIRPVWNSEIEPFPIRVTTKHLPEVKHYGEIRTMSGGDVTPVDIITFGSPCTDMSIAGRRAGLEGRQSSLFFEAIRIVKEMRDKTNGKYPRYIVWENVTGAFSSNKGEDFRRVLEEICGVKKIDIPSARPEKWKRAGCIMGDGFSLAWRVLDAEYWGVPQRRQRIYLVADFAGESAPKILFESEHLSGYSPEGFQKWKAFAGRTAECTDSPVQICLDDEGGLRMSVFEGRSGTLRANGNHTPLVLFESHGRDGRFSGPKEPAPCLSALLGTGGNNQPLVMKEPGKDVKPQILQIRSGPAAGGGGTGLLTQEDRCSALTCRHDQTLFEPCRVYYLSSNTRYRNAQMDIASTLTAREYKEAPVVKPESKETMYLVRHLTPLECSRLQGFPDWWAEELETDDPPQEEVDFWKQVFDEYSRATGKNIKRKTDYQIRKWLKGPFADAAKYKMWGNGVALPCVVFVLSGIAYFGKQENEDGKDSNH